VLRSAGALLTFRGLIGEEEAYWNAYNYLRERTDDYQIHPGLLDCGFQLLGAALPGAGTGIDAYVPMGLERLRLYDRPQGPTWYLISLKSLENNVATGDIRLVDQEGRTLMEIDGMRLRRVPRDWLTKLVAEPTPDWLYELAWIPKPLETAATDDAIERPGRWLIFDTSNGLGAGLADRLDIKGHRCRVVTLDGGVDSRFETVRGFLSDDETPCRGIVYLAYGHESEGKEPSTTNPDFEGQRQRGWGGVMDIVHALVRSGTSHPPRLWLVSRGAQSVGDSEHSIRLAQAPIWGLGRVIASEHPELACTRIDLDPTDRRAAEEQLAEEIWAEQSEDQVAYREGARFVARLRAMQRADMGLLDLPYGQPYRLEIVSRGQLDNVALRPMLRQKPGPGQVEVKIRATGLNFRDVLNVLDLYPGDPGPLGGECAGEIVAVGEGVEEFKPGDQVFALAPASFSNYVITLAEFVVAKPDHLTFAQAAAIPICFVTAHYALCKLGKMKRGDRVLIHAASGGVGTAAIQIARQIGAEVFATAGKSAKRDYLKSLGIEHVMDSRSLDFAEQILEVTGGEGVDLVVNSLTGDAIAKSLSVLRDGGSFLELGKTDLWDQQQVDEFQPGVTFHAIALDQMMAERPDIVGELMREVASQFADGRLEPSPLATFPIQNAVEAFRHMARAEHIGKIAIEAADDSIEVQQFSLRNDATYLVTGGLGGLGMKVAGWLADKGAGHIVLVGRSGPQPEVETALEELRQAGVDVVARRCDVASRSKVADLLADLNKSLPPLKGVLHLAGVLDDGLLRDLTRERFDRVMAAKAYGAWHLHELTRDRSLDLFVLFSSVATLLGSPGQGNYAAANAFLDALAHYRRRHNLPALSVNWGSWSEVGMAARLKETEGDRWAAAGIGWIEPEKGLETLEQLLVEDRTQAGVMPIDWGKFFEQIPVGSEPPWLTDLAREARSAAPQAHSGPPVLAEKLQGVTPGERLEVAVTSLQQQAARVLAMDDGSLPDPRRPLNELGFDSLTAVEFCNRVGRTIAKSINPMILFDYPTLESLAVHVVVELLQLECQTESKPEGADREEPVDEIDQQALAEVEGMREEDMDAVVAEQIEKLEQSG